MLKAVVGEGGFLVFDLVEFQLQIGVVALLDLSSVAVDAKLQLPGRRMGETGQCGSHGLAKIENSIA